MTDHREATSSSPSLDLNTDLRLHPQQLNLGKAELLTDALTLPFTDIESRLGHYALDTSGQEAARLRKSMKNYLGRLNANPLIPLTYRLKVLNRFEQELNLFDAEMTTAVLNAHKIGVTLVQEKARSDSSYYPTLVDMIANAIELAVKLLLISLEQYRAPAIIITRQFFDLARLGLDVSAAMGAEAPSKTARLNRAICNHEMLRRLDFFGKTVAQQRIIWQELQYHIGTLNAHYCRAGEQITAINDDTYMLINLNRPNEPGCISKQTGKPFKYDCIAIPLDNFTARLDKGIHSVESVLHDQQMQKKALHTEVALESSMVGGSAILAAVRSIQRSGNRAIQSETRVQLVRDQSKAIMRAFSAADSAANPETFDQSRAWNLVDLNPQGICLERIFTEPLADMIGLLVGLDWLFGEDRLKLKFIPWKEGMDEKNSEAPRLGFIRWARENKAGEQRIGIAFFSSGYKLAKAVMLGGSKEMDEKRTWPILVKPGSASHTVIIPESNVYKHMTFMILQGKNSAHFKIKTISIAGPNYSQCAIVHARTKGTTAN